MEKEKLHFYHIYHHSTETLFTVLKINEEEKKRRGKREEVAYKERKRYK